VSAIAIGRRAFGAGVGSLAAFGLAGCRRLPDEARGRVVVPFWFSYGGKNREVLLDLVSRFHAEQRDVWIDAVFQGDYFEALAKVRTAVAAGAAPPLTHVVGEVVPYLAEARVLEPLDAYRELAGRPFVRALAQAGAFEGGEARPLWAVPFNRSTPIMFVNADWLARENVQIPRNWDELRIAARALTTRDPLRWGFVVPISWWFWVAMMGQAGGRLVDPSRVPTLGGAAGEKALAFLEALVHDDRVMRPPPGRDYNAWGAANQDFLGGRAAMLWTSTAYVRYLEENASFRVVAAPLPSDVRASVPTGGTFFVILEGAPAELKAAAARFLAWMSGPGPAASFATRTGYIPVVEDAIEELRRAGYYAAHPNDAVAMRQLADVDPWPWAPSLFRVQRDVVEPRLEDAVFRRLDPRAVLGEARALARKHAR
jgi:sn-glycerol 3-phosphate transport system substrate-binding protein